LYIPPQWLLTFVLVGCWKDVSIGHVYIVICDNTPEVVCKLTEEKEEDINHKKIKGKECIHFTMTVYVIEMIQQTIYKC
jgi:hypothetical protein